MSAAGHCAYAGCGRAFTGRWNQRYCRAACKKADERERYARGRVSNLAAGDAERAVRAEALLRHVEDMVGRAPRLANLYGKFLPPPDDERGGKDGRG